jgi:hypothetical protein
MEVEMEVVKVEEMEEEREVEMGVGKEEEREEEREEEMEVGEEREGEREKRFLCSQSRGWWTAATK